MYEGYHHFKKQLNINYVLSAALRVYRLFYLFLTNILENGYLPLQSHLGLKKKNASEVLGILTRYKNLNFQ